MSETCALCKEEPRIPHERYCKKCKKVVIDRGREANRERNTPPKLVSEARGRKCRSAQVLGGAPKWEEGDA